MSEDRSLVRKHVEALLAEGKARSVPADVIGRLLLEEVTALWLQTRAWRDVAAELEFHAKSLDPDADFEFMRP